MKFEKIPGDLSLLQRLLNGHWNSEDFLTIPPGARIIADHTERIVKADLGT